MYLGSLERFMQCGCFELECNVTILSCFSAESAYINNIYGAEITKKIEFLVFCMPLRTLYFVYSVIRFKLTRFTDYKGHVRYNSCSMCWFPKQSASTSQKRKFNSILIWEIMVII